MSLTLFRMGEGGNMPPPLHTFNFDPTKLSQQNSKGCKIHIFIVERLWKNAMSHNSVNIEDVNEEICCYNTNFDFTPM